eukprot:6192474-Pleurochrysis_carterae.AAC.1
MRKIDTSTAANCTLSIQDAQTTDSMILKTSCGAKTIMRSVSSRFVKNAELKTHAQAIADQTFEQSAVQSWKPASAQSGCSGPSLPRARFNLTRSTTLP